MSVIGNGIVLKRLPQNVDLRKDITAFGEDNLYPQRVEQVALRSPTTIASIKAYGTFLGGNGFELNGDLVINRFDQTLNDLLRLIRKDKATFDGWALHFNVNEIGGITEIIPVKYKNVRYGLPDDWGRHYEVKLNLNWEEDYSKTIKKVAIIQDFPLWHTRDKHSFDSEEGENGFVYYWTPEMDMYPTCTFDSVLDSAQSNGEIQVYELGNIQNSFLNTSLFKHQGKIEGEKERQALVNLLFSLTGPENAGGVGLVEVPTGFDGNLLENIPANNGDTLFQTTNETTQSRIVSNFGIPYPLLGLQPTGGGIYNQEQLNDAYTFYNTQTREERKSISDAFDSFMKFWHEGAVSVGGIIENEFKVQEDGSDINNEG